MVPSRPLSPTVVQARATISEPARLTRRLKDVTSSRHNLPLDDYLTSILQHPFHGEFCMPELTDDVLTGYLSVDLDPDGDLDLE